MCSGPEQSNSNSSTTQEASAKKSTSMKDLNKLSVETEDSFSSLLEFAANNDVEALKRSVEVDLSLVDQAGLWYIRKKGSKLITQEERTPLMVAATYGSIDVLKLLIALPEVDLNRACGKDKWTALHCAAFSGSIQAIEIVKLLLSAGADPNVEDANGHCPVDVIVPSPKLDGAKAVLEVLLTSNNNSSDGSIGDRNLRVSISSSNTSSPVLSSSPEYRSSVSPSDSPTKNGDASNNNQVSEKKQYPVDPSLPDIRNSIYSSDEFRMYSFKIRPCSRAYSHDWTECPFVHPGENARRRDPRKFHYSCVPCPDFRKGACRRGDMCEYAHGVFESWLHPAQYRTKLCKDGTSCNRQVCFFAHAPEDLRPLYASTGSGVPSPRSSGATTPGFMDMAMAMNLLPGSPTSQSVMSPSSFNQTFSPNSNGISHSNTPWSQPNVPTLHLPGSNLQSSRLRSSLNARDLPPEDFNSHKLALNDLASFTQPQSNPNMLNYSANRAKPTLTPSNLEELFSAEISSSPRFFDHGSGFGVFSPSHKAAGLTQFQHQQQSMLSPINTNTNNVFSPRNMEHPLLQASLGVSSPRMSPRSLDATSASPMSARISAIANREKQLQQMSMRSLSSRELGSVRVPVNGSPHANNPWSKFGSPNGKADWSVNAEGQTRLKRSSSFELNNNGDEPDLSWVHSLVKESPPEMMNRSGAEPSGECLNSNSGLESVDQSVLGAWLEQMQLDQLKA